MTVTNNHKRSMRRSQVAIRPDCPDVLWRDARHYENDLLVEWSSITKTVTARLLTELSKAGLVTSSLKVAEVLPQVPLRDATLLDLSRHRSGLPMMHQGASTGLLGDPCRGSDDVHFLERIGPAAVEAARGFAGKFRYSNLGYAILGIALEKICDRPWINLVHDWVLPATDFPTVTISPTPDQQTVPSLCGFRRRPWSMSDGAYQAAGGLWSTFDDLIAYAENALEHDPVSGWFILQDDIRYHTGQARDTGVCVVLDLKKARVGVVHAMLRSPNATKRILEQTMLDSGC